MKNNMITEVGTDLDMVTEDAKQKAPAWSVAYVEFCFNGG